MRVLVTGATGTLGREVVGHLAAAGHDIVALSRRDREPKAGVEWVRGDLRTGAGLHEACRGVGVVVHAATDGGFPEGRFRPQKIYLASKAVNVEGTARLLRAAAEAGAPHVIYASIVGMEGVAYGYYKQKLRSEEMVRDSGLPFTIVRLTQFHTLVDTLVRFALRFPIAALPLRHRYQPLDPGEAGGLVARHVSAEPAGDTVNYGGPEQRTLADLAQAWCAERGVRRRFRKLPMPGTKGVERGALLTEDRSGTITWEHWLRKEQA